MVVYAAWMFSEMNNFIYGMEANDGVCISIAIRGGCRGPNASILEYSVGTGSATICRDRSDKAGIAIEATKLGFGGVEYIAEVLRCATRTIARGAHELGRLPIDPAEGRVRRPGAGRKKNRIRTETLTKSENNPGGANRRRPRRERRAVDRPLAATDCGRGDGHENAGQSAGCAGMDGRAKNGAPQDRKSSRRRKSSRSRRTIPADRHPDRDAQLRRIAIPIETHNSGGSPS
jgi:hypothetical protein